MVQCKIQAAEVEWLIIISIPQRHAYMIGFRLAAGVLLLAAAILFTGLTVDGLSARRQLRTELAEISHVRYGVLNADRWVERMLPILDAKINALDLKAA